MGYRIVRPNGEIRVVMANGEAYAEQQSSYGGRIFGTVQDITERVALESMHLKVKKAEAESKAKGDFLAVMSHELRTPLHGIIGLQDMLAKDAHCFSAQQQEYLTLAQHSALLLSELIGDILDLSKIESDSVVLELQSIDLEILLDHAMSTFLAAMQGKGVQLELRLEAIPKQVHGDACRIRQILLNIIGNAVKFTEEGKVILNACMRDDLLHIEISDTGIGIAPGDMERMFEPFCQLSNAAERQGTGLGTTIAMRFARMMGGSINVQSELGKGSTFSIDLALEVVGDERVSRSVILEQHISDKQEIPASKTHPMKPLKFLLAEDDPISRFIAVEKLKSAGLSVDVAENGLIAWEKLQGDRYDVLLTDIRMPGVDGLELTRKVRQHETVTQHHMYIIGLTAHSLQHIADEAEQAGMDDFISKPIDPDALMQRLRERLNTLLDEG